MRYFEQSPLFVNDCPNPGEGPVVGLTLGDITQLYEHQNRREGVTPEAFVERTIDWMLHDDEGAGAWMPMLAFPCPYSVERGCQVQENLPYECSLAAGQGADRGSGKYVETAEHFRSISVDPGIKEQVDLAIHVLTHTPGLGAKLEGSPFIDSVRGMLANPSYFSGDALEAIAYAKDRLDVRVVEMLAGLETE